MRREQIHTNISILLAACVIAATAGCGIRIRPEPPPPQYHEVFVEMQTTQTIVMPPQTDTNLINTIANRAKSLTIRQINTQTPIRVTDTCTPDGLHLKVDMAGLTFSQSRETTGSLIRPKATTIESSEIYYTQHTIVSRCSDNRVLDRAEEEYDGKEITRILGKAAEDAADAVLKAARTQR